MLVGVADSVTPLEGARELPAGFNLRLGNTAQRPPIPLEPVAEMITFDKEPRDTGLEVKVAAKAGRVGVGAPERFDVVLHKQPLHFPWSLVAIGESDAGIEGNGRDHSQLGLCRHRSVLTAAAWTRRPLGDISQILFAVRAELHEGRYCRNPDATVGGTGAPPTPRQATM